MFVEQPTMKGLFSQLGLDNSDRAIEQFIEAHQGMAESQHIEDAPFWSASQAAFLKTAINDDADWAEVIDQLNMMLHQD